MDVERLSPHSRDLLREVASAGELVNVLYADGARDDAGFRRESRCFALGERGWLEFLGWEGAPAARNHCKSRWALSHEAQRALARS